jgi:crotonobetainyl-CoA:carnitine CoA-transferase CaiB-like acyl-CoA transferase
MLLADLGARVVKVEHPDGGDVTRGWGPPCEPASGLSSYYLATRVAENREVLERDLERAFRASPRAHWIAACRRAGVPAGPVQGPLEALRSGTAGSLGAVVSAAGVKFVASPIRVEGQTVPLRFPSKLDEHGEALRREFGLPSNPVIPRSVSDEESLP